MSGPNGMDDLRVAPRYRDERPGAFRAAAPSVEPTFVVTHQCGDCGALWKGDPMGHKCPPPDRVAGLRGDAVIEQAYGVRYARDTTWLANWLADEFSGNHDFTDAAERLAALLDEPVPLDVERLRCGWCGDDLLLTEIVGHLLSEGRTIPDAARLTDPKGATDGE